MAEPDDGRTGDGEQNGVAPTIPQNPANNEASNEQIAEQRVRNEQPESGADLLIRAENQISDNAGQIQDGAGRFSPPRQDLGIPDLFNLEPSKANEILQQLSARFTGITVASESDQALIDDQAANFHQLLKQMQGMIGAHQHLQDELRAERQLRNQVEHERKELETAHEKPSFNERLKELRRRGTGTSSSEPIVEQSQPERPQRAAATVAGLQIRDIANYEDSKTGESNNPDETRKFQVPRSMTPLEWAISLGKQKNLAQDGKEALEKLLRTMTLEEADVFRQEMIKHANAIRVLKQSAPKPDATQAPAANQQMRNVPPLRVTIDEATRYAQAENLLTRACNLATRPVRTHQENQDLILIVANLPPEQHEVFARIFYLNKSDRPKDLSSGSGYFADRSSSADAEITPPQSAPRDNSERQRQIDGMKKVAASAERVHVRSDINLSDIYPRDPNWQQRLADHGPRPLPDPSAFNSPPNAQHLAQSTPQDGQQGVPCPLESQPTTTPSSAGSKNVRFESHAPPGQSNSHGGQVAGASGHPVHSHAGPPGVRDNYAHGHAGPSHAHAGQAHGNAGYQNGQYVHQAMPNLGQGSYNASHFDLRQQNMPSPQFGPDPTFRSSRLSETIRTLPAVSTNACQPAALRPIPPFLTDDAQSSLQDNRKEQLQMRRQTLLEQREMLRLQIMSVQAMNPHALTPFHRPVVEEYGKAIDNIDEQCADLDAKIANIEAVQQSIVPSLKFPKTFGQPCSRRNLNYQEIRAFVGKIEYIKSDTERLVYIWDKLRDYGEKRIFSEWEFKDALGCILDPTLNKVFTAVKSNSLRSILDTLAHSFVSEETLFDHQDQVTGFTRKPEETINAAVSRLSILVNECVKVYPPAERETRRSIMLDRGVRDMSNPKARPELDRLSADYLARGSHVPIKELIRVAQQEERIHGPPDTAITASISVNAASVAPTLGNHVPHDKPSVKADSHQHQKATTTHGKSSSDSKPNGYRSRDSSRNSRYGDKKSTRDYSKDRSSRDRSHDSQAGQDRSSRRDRDRDDRDRGRSRDRTRDRDREKDGKSTRDRSDSRAGNRRGSSSSGQKKKLNIGARSGGYCDFCGSDEPHSATTCYALKGFFKDLAEN